MDSFEGIAVCAAITIFSGDSHKHTCYTAPLLGDVNNGQVLKGKVWSKMVVRVEKNQWHTKTDAEPRMTVGVCIAEQPQQDGRNTI